jgi:thymidine kinase
MDGMMPVAGDEGWVEAICGSMFSGKTEELIRRLVRAQIARQKIQVFKPAIDARYSKEEVVSHSGGRIASIEVQSANEILERVHADTKVVGIDEAQFLGMDLVRVIEELAQSGRRVVVAGLDQDSRGVPFEPVPQILAIAELVTKTMAVCVVCGRPANKTQRLAADSNRVLVGAAEAYEARCRTCWSPEPVGALSKPAGVLIPEKVGASGP